MSGKPTSNGACAVLHYSAELNLIASNRRGLTIPFHRNIMAAMADWDPEREALFYVIDKEAGGVVAKYKVCFMKAS